MDRGRKGAKERGAHGSLNHEKKEPGFYPDSSRDFM